MKSVLLRPSVAVFLLMMVIGLLPMTSAHADAPVEVQLTKVSPQTITGDENITVAGTVSNPTDQPQQITVQLWRDATPLRSHESLEMAATSAAAGDVVRSPAAVQTFEDPLQPGGSESFSITFPVSGAEPLYLSEPGAVYQVGVQVTSRTVSGMHHVTHARAFVVNPGTLQAQVASIVMLTHQPTRLPLDDSPDGDPVFANNSLVAALDGELGELLDFALASQVPVIIDPAVYDEATIIATGQYRYYDGAELVAGDDESATIATRWLRRINNHMADARVWRGLYGMPDIGAGRQGGLDLVEQATIAIGDDHPLAELPLVVTPRAGSVTDDLVDDLARVSPRYVLASDVLSTGVLGRHNDVSLIRTTGEDPVVVSADGAATAQNRLLAEQFVSALTEDVTVSVIRNADQLANVHNAPTWQTPVALDAVLDAEPQAVTFTNDTLPPPAEQLIHTTNEVSDTARAWSQMRFPEHADQRAATLLSTSWGIWGDSDGTQQSSWLTDATALAREGTQPTAFSLQVSNWVTTSEDDNWLPVTVTNHTDYPVAVKVGFESSNHLRISVEDSDPVVVDPHQTSTVRVKPHTKANGTVDLVAQLLTIEGNPIGVSTEFVATGTGAGKVAWVIIVISAAVLLLATGWRIKAVRHRNGEDD